MKNLNRKYFGTTEIARICHVTSPTVVRWIEDGELPYFSTGGGHRRVWVEDLLVFLRSHNIPIPGDLQVYGKPRVLIVDDEKPARQVVAKVLSKMDVEIHEAVDGFEAGLKITALVPTLVILDIQLPGADGLKVCRMIRSQPSLNHVRILTTSGYNVEETRGECLKAGADGFLGKPFDVAELEKHISALLLHGRKTVHD